MLKQEIPVTRSIQKWSDNTDDDLQDGFVNTDWNMFWNSSDGIEYTTSVTGFINKCINDVVPTVTIRVYTPTRDQWITSNIRTELKSRDAAVKERDSNPDVYKKSLYALRRTIKQAKHQD